MKSNNRSTLLGALILLGLAAACSNPSSATPGASGLNNSSNSNSPVTPPASSTYSFDADYSYQDSLGSGAVAHGSIYSNKDNGATWATDQSIASTPIDTTFNLSNSLPVTTPGSLVYFSVTLNENTFTGSAVVPDKLTGVKYDRANQVVTWDKTPLSHPAAYVTVRKNSDGSLTIPAGWASSASADAIDVYASNEAANLAPATNLDSAHAYFRVSHADGTSDHFTY